MGQVQRANKMNAREFFYLVAQMRSAQKEYFRGRDPLALRAARTYENMIDAEIERVRQIVSESESTAPMGDESAGHSS